ncbi:hypothetical protein DPMN_193981 [Dreissena polymorpha]|uniref:Uncharacterized protein n=1 Tax=Dreissena polymorpha TaxID=45954 RepID=A0A9D3Y5B9_DREPO|nr:hypothetical protein DPMN_193981 [Dreissena polymorpha]
MMLRTLSFGALCIALTASASIPSPSLLEGFPFSTNTETPFSKPKMALDDIQFPIQIVPADPETEKTTVTPTTTAVTTTNEQTIIEGETTTTAEAPATTTQQPITATESFTTTTTMNPTLAVRETTTTDATETDPTTVLTPPMTTPTTPASTSTTPKVIPSVTQIPGVLLPIFKNDDNIESDSHDNDYAYSYHGEGNDDHSNHGEGYDDLHENSMSDEDFWKQYDKENDHVGDDDWNFWLNGDSADVDHWLKDILGHDGFQGEMLMDKPAAAGSLLAPKKAEDQLIQLTDIPQLPLEPNVEDMKPIPHKDTKAIIEHIDRDLDTMYFNTKSWLSALGNGDAMDARAINKLQKLDKFMDNVSSRMSMFLTLLLNMPTETRTQEGSTYDHGAYKK